MLEKEAFAAMRSDRVLAEKARELFNLLCKYKYSYNFEWLGRPIIQFPQDIVAIQELVWSVQPDLIVETGVAHGGSLMLSASLLALLEQAERVRGVTEISPRRVIGIDIEIRRANRLAIEAHPFSSYITLIEGSSVDPAVIETVVGVSREFRRVMVMLDSNHTRDHVLEELRLYSPIVSQGSYCVVFDTVIDEMPPDSFPDRPWSVGDSPMTAVREFLDGNDDWQVDEVLHDKLQLTVAPFGFLRRR